MAIPSTTTPASDRDAEKRRQLQHFLVMKAFNLRKGQPLTLAQQFQFLRKVDAITGRGYVELGALCEYLSIPPFRRMILCQIFGVEVDAPTPRLDFDGFLRFLQTAAVQAAKEENELRKQYSTDSLPKPPPPKASIHEHALVRFEPSLLSMRFAHPPPAPGLWKKREISIQERITEYTKIDELGRAQHLVEKEKHQSEVVHMESLAGEFAHREITHYEQLEKLNDEVVHHEAGREEFVHLKSQTDEVSKFESSIPATQNAARPEECEQPPPSPTIKRDPSTMNCNGSDGARAFPSGDVPMEMTPEEEDAFYKYQQQQQYETQENDDQYPLEPDYK